MAEPVFVFGSNLAGRHGAGAALYAVRNRGAVWGCGIGHHGDSYAIPTKGCHLEVLGLEEIGDYITNFLSYAARHPELTFNVTRIDIQCHPDWMWSRRLCGCPDGPAVLTRGKLFLPYRMETLAGRGGSLSRSSLKAILCSQKL